MAKVIGGADHSHMVSGAFDGYHPQDGGGPIGGGGAEAPGSTMGGRSGNAPGKAAEEHSSSFQYGFNTVGRTVADHSGTSTTDVPSTIGKSVESYGGRPDKTGALPGKAEGYAAAQQAASEQVADAASDKSDAVDNKMMRKQQMNNLAPRGTGK